METFEEFLKRIIKVAFWLLIIIPMMLAPLAFLLIEAKLLPPLPVSPYAFISNPDQVLPIIQEVNSSPFFKIAVFPGFTTAALIATAIILLERKLLAKINLRVGPLYAGRFEGILQPIADLFKLLFKELIIPRKADKPFFVLAPLGIFAVGSALLAVIPLAPDVFITKSSLGLLIFFATMGFFPLIVLAASWASSNKFAFIGGLRALHQFISYEIPMLLAALAVALASGSLDLFEIVEAQATMWFIVPQIIGAMIFFTAALAELERIPFDLPEADTEIVAGWLTEYSGMFFGLLQLAVYVKFYALSALFTILFLGGWMGPPFLPPVAWFLLKTIIVMVAMIIPRGANPRLRIDLLIRLGWGWLIILAVVNLLIAIGTATLRIF